MAKRSSSPSAQYEDVSVARRRRPSLANGSRSAASQRPRRRAVHRRPDGDRAAHRLARPRHGALERRRPVAPRGGQSVHGPRAARAVIRPSDPRCRPIAARVRQLRRVRCAVHRAGCRLELPATGQALPAGVDLVVLAGAKATLRALAMLREQGWHIDILAHVRRAGGCSAFAAVIRCSAAASQTRRGWRPSGEEPGLGLLDVDTVIAGDKTLRRVDGRLAGSGAAFEGYKIHLGKTCGAGTTRPFLRMSDGRPDGAVSANGWVAGAHAHGLFGPARNWASGHYVGSGGSLGGLVQTQVRSNQAGDEPRLSYR